MKFLRNLLPIAVVALGFTSSAAYADYCGVESYHNANRQRDFEAVQEFVNSKRTIGLQEKECNLTISGDIRFDWAHIQERVHCHKLRGVKNGTARQFPAGEFPSEVIDIADPLFLGTKGGIPFSTDAFEVEFNLYFDYVCDRAWAVAWVEFDDCAGISNFRNSCLRDPEGLFGSGNCDGLCLKKAYMGYNILADGCSRLDIEVGRRPKYTVFDSRIQFQSRFDGVLLKYFRGIDCWGDFYWFLGANVVDERTDYYAYITELGLLNIYDTGLDARYSFNDWKSLLSHDRNRCGTHNPRGSDYKISQWTLSYSFNPEYLCLPTKLYGAFLWNHAARRHETTHKHYRYGWYVGFIVGEVCREGDWSFDMNYQVVQPFAIPDLDVSGIGANGGNLLNDRTTINGRGFANYKGWRFEGLYALTDNLSLDAILEFYRQDTKALGGKHSYSKFELQAIYAF